MATRDFSIYPVLLLNPDRTPTEPKSFTRAVRTRQGLGVGAYCDVEFGGAFAEERGQKRWVSGDWRQCRVVESLAMEGEAQTIFVVLDPHPKKAPADIPFG